jgi:hypothetical protein
MSLSSSSAMQHSVTINILPFVRKWLLLPDVWNGNGNITHSAEAHMGAPCFRQLCLTERHVSMASSSLMERNAYYTRTRGFTDCNLISSVSVHMSCYGRVRMWGSKAQRLRHKYCSYDNPPRKAFFLGFVLAGSLPSMTTQIYTQQKHLHVEKVKQMAICVSMETRTQK